MLSKKNINIEIGIIIPIYNAQSTLHKCINSVLIQSYTNFKLILINDGSKDDSENICQQYAENDKRIIVYSQNNSGVSTARNKGIELCTSPYLCFIDADDYLDAHYLQNFVEGIVAFPNVDMVFQGINRISTNHTEKLFRKQKFIPGKNFLKVFQILINIPFLDISVPRCIELRLSNVINSVLTKISASVKTVFLLCNI